MKDLDLASRGELSACSRAGEITTILAAAIVRTLGSSGLEQSAVRLGFLPDQRVHTTPSQQEKL